MDRILTLLGIRSKDKYENKCLHKNLSREDNDTDNDYVLNIDRSIIYDCKRLSVSYTLLSDSPKQYNKHLSGCASLSSLSTDKVLKNDKNDSKRRTVFLNSSSKSSTVQSNKISLKRRLFSRFRFRKNIKENNGVSDADRKLHVVWYTANKTPEAESEVKFRHSWNQNNRQKELATTIAAELESKTRTKSLLLRNTDKHSILTDNQFKQQF